MAILEAIAILALTAIALFFFLRELTKLSLLYLLVILDLAIRISKTNITRTDTHHSVG